jgi:hypothetical protein
MSSLPWNPRKRPAADEIESLVAEADRRARVIVCEELVGQLVERYRSAIAEVLAGQRPQPARDDVPPPAEPAPEPRMPADPPDRSGTRLDTAWYLYAIARISDISGPAGVEDLPGVEGRRVELITSDDLAAVAAEVPLAGFRASGDEPDLSPDGWLHKAVRAHEAVVERLCTRATALPFRFGALYPSRDHARAVLRERAGQLRAELDRLDGCAEWGVKVRTTEPEPGREEPPTAADATDGTEWMLRRREAAAARQESQRRHSRVGQEVDDALSRHAREGVVRAAARPGEPGALVFDAVYLVPHSAEADFQDALGEIGSRYPDEDLRLELTGPWPPYHFVDLPADGLEPLAGVPQPRSAQQSATRGSRPRAPYGVGP